MPYVGQPPPMALGWYVFLNPTDLDATGSGILPRQWLNPLRSRQNGRHFADDIFKGIVLNENVLSPIKISLWFVPMGPINNFPALV